MCAAVTPVIYEALESLAVRDLRVTRVWAAGAPLLLIASFCPSAGRRGFVNCIAIVGTFLVLLSESSPGPRPILVGALIAAGSLLGVRIDLGLVPGVVSRMVLLASLLIIVSALGALLSAEVLSIVPLWLASIPIWILAIGSISFRGRLAAALSIYTLMLVESVSLSFELIPVFTNLAYGAVFIIATRYVGAMMRLLAPIVTLAATLIAAGITFYQREPPESYTAIAAYIEGTGPGTPISNRIDELRIDLLDGGCKPSSTRLTVSWGSESTDQRSRRIVVAADSSTFSRESAAGVVFGVTREWDWGSELVLTEGESNGTEVEIETLRATAPAGIGTCYLLVPVLIGQEAMVKWEAGRSRLMGGEPPAETEGLKAGPAKVAHVTVNAEGGGLSVVRGPGTETDSGGQATWTCDAKKVREYISFPTGTFAPDSCVQGVVLITKPWRRNFEQVMLLVIGALFSVVVELFIRALGR